MISFLSKIRSHWKILPNSRFKSGVNSIFFRTAKYALLQELGSLPVEESGLKYDNVPFVKLSNGKIFFGFFPSEEEQELYDSIRNILPEKLCKDSFRIAIDIITRYKYPHALPSITPPYVYLMRYAFHPQHITTIKDTKHLDKNEKIFLTEKFQVHKGDTVLEAGSFLGFGTMKLSQLVGSTGKVVAIEALPEAQALLRRNIEENGLTNVEIINKAVSDNISSIELLKEDLQANSIITGMIGDIKDREIVNTCTIDQIASDLNLSKLDLVSLTVNGAEPEALKGMSEVCAKFEPVITAAGWYIRDGRPLYQHEIDILDVYGYQSTKIGVGRVLAWK